MAGVLVSRPIATRIARVVCVFVQELWSCSTVFSDVQRDQNFEIDTETETKPLRPKTEAKLLRPRPNSWDQDWNQGRILENKTKTEEKPLRPRSRANPLDRDWDRILETETETEDKTLRPRPNYRDRDWVQYFGPETNRYVRSRSNSKPKSWPWDRAETFGLETESEAETRALRPRPKPTFRCRERSGVDTVTSLPWSAEDRWCSRVATRLASAAGWRHSATREESSTKTNVAALMSVRWRHSIASCRNCPSQARYSYDTIRYEMLF